MAEATGSWDNRARLVALLIGGALLILLALTQGAVMMPFIFGIVLYGFLLVVVWRVMLAMERMAGALEKVADKLSAADLSTEVRKEQ